MLGYEFPSTFLLFQKDKLSILCSATKGAALISSLAGKFLILSSARILEQLQKHRTIVPVEIFTLAKSKDPPSDALPRFLTVFTSNQRIGSLSKETYAGKLIDEWNNALTSSTKKPEVVDIASAISTFMSVKDDEELVRRLININILFGCDVHS